MARYPRRAPEAHAPRFMHTRLVPGRDERVLFGRLIANCYTPKAQPNGDLLSRPPFTTATYPGAPAAWTNSVRTLGWIRVVTRAGARYQYAITDQGIFQLTYSGNYTFTVTDRTPAANWTGVVTTYRWRWVSFNGKVILTNGIDRPRVLSGFGGALTATIIDVDGAGTAWTARGKPTVYAGKVMFILNTLGAVPIAQPPTIVWSEEVDETLGYLQPNYDDTNSWVLAQTGEERLQAILGTNDAFFFWRDSSMGAIFGATTDDFTTAHTSDAISEDIGTLSPDSVVAHGQAIDFLDQMRRPQRYVRGAGLQVDPPLHDPITDLVAIDSGSADWAAQYFPNAWGRYVHALDVVLFSMPYSSAVIGNRLAFAFQAGSGRCFGRWSVNAGSGSDPSLARSLEHSEDCWLYSGSESIVCWATNTAPANSFVFLSDEQAALSGNDSTSGVILPIDCVVQTQPMFYDERVDQVFDEIETTGSTAVTRQVRYRTTTEGYQAAQAHTPVAIGGAEEIRYRATTGINGHGRHLTAEVSAATATRFSLDTVTAWGTPDSAQPSGA